MNLLDVDGVDVWGFYGSKGFCQRRVGNWKKIYISLKDGMLGLYKDNTKKEIIKEYDIRKCYFFDTVKSLNKPCSLKIVTENKKSINICTEKLKDIDDIKLELENSHGIFKGYDKKVDEKVFDIEGKPVNKWNNEDCCNWLRLVGAKQLLPKFKEMSITGDVLTSFDQTIFQDTFEIEREFAVSLFDDIRELKENGYFTKKFVIRNKFKKFDGYEKEMDNSPVLESLCDPVKIKHNFLSTAERYYFKELQKSKNAENQAIERFNETRLGIKLVVTETVQTSKSQKLKKAVSPLINQITTFKKKMQYFSTAVIVGPWYLEWNDSELVVPKRMVSGRAVITADVDTLFVKRKGLLEISDKIADVVAKWNSKYKYDNKEKKKKGKKNQYELQGNCQDFVDDILNAIGVKQEFEGALGDFIQRMRLESRAEMELNSNDEFCSKFGIPKRIIFKTHKQLDETVLNFIKKDLEFTERYSSEWMLLKSFDRAFWMRHLNDVNKNSDIYKPLPPKKNCTFSEFPTGCPFKDPRTTYSIIP